MKEIKVFRNWLYLFILISVLYVISSSCKKKEDENNDNNIIPPVTLTDIDGNVYNTVTIGTQIWMTENLKVTHYRNGDEIPCVTTTPTWDGLTYGAYCYYDNDPNYVSTYGILYNWFAVTDNRDIAPDGWHVPTKEEFFTLLSFVGGSGGKLKETDTLHWNSPNAGATNETGFTGLPGGSRGLFGIYQQLGARGIWWSTTGQDTTAAALQLFDYSDMGNLSPTAYKICGFSVRCIKD